MSRPVRTPSSLLRVSLLLAAACPMPVAWAQSSDRAGPAVAPQIECPGPGADPQDAQPPAAVGDGTDSNDRGIAGVGEGEGGRAETFCRTDVPTFVGWRVYVEHCAGCHAEDALGSEFAPSLVHRLQRFDRRAFYSALDNGYLGRDAGLGPWGADANVARYYEELWIYLSARADGRLPPVPLRPLRGAVQR